MNRQKTKSQHLQQEKSRALLNFAPMFTGLRNLFAQHASCAVVICSLIGGLWCYCTYISQAGPLSELILFSLREGGKFRIYQMRPDGNELQRVVKLSQNCREPNMCPSTGEIAFSALHEGMWSIYILDSKTKAITPMDDHNSNDRHPIWSPDGSRIVFETDRWGYSELALYDRRLDKCVRLTFNQSNNCSPCWSPDGSKVAYTSWLDSIANIYVINFEQCPTRTSSQTPAEITENQPTPAQVGRSDDDTLLQLDSAQTNDEPEAIDQQNAPRNEDDLELSYSIQRITKGHDPCTSPCWNADGSRLAFATRDYYLHFIGTTDLHYHTENLRQSSQYGYNPAWSPDNKSILFSYARRREHKLMIYDVENETCREFPRQFGQRVYDLVWQRRPLPWQIPENT